MFFNLFLWSDIYFFSHIDFFVELFLIDCVITINTIAHARYASKPFNKALTVSFKAIRLLAFASKCLYHFSLILIIRALFVVLKFGFLDDLLLECIFVTFFDHHTCLSDFMSSDELVTAAGTVAPIITVIAWSEAFTIHLQAFRLWTLTRVIHFRRLILKFNGAHFVHKSLFFFKCFLSFTSELN